MNVWRCLNTYAYVYTFIYMLIYILLYVCLYVYSHTYAYIYTLIYILSYICSYIYAYTYSHIYAYLYILSAVLLPYCMEKFTLAVRETIVSGHNGNPMKSPYQLIDTIVQRYPGCPQWVPIIEC